MNKFTHDINDDEIRVISSDRQLPVKDSCLHDNDSKKKKYRGCAKWLLLIAILLLAAVAFILFLLYATTDYRYYPEPRPLPLDLESNNDTVVVVQTKNESFVEMIDTIVGNVPLSIFIPKNAVPKLQIGLDALNDSSAVLVVQAADTRRDNEEIVGAYVLEGELKSRGQSKAGFCAIINGKLTIGVADATPYLEQAIETDGYFFRQYPLVVGGQVVENKLKPSSLRKALAELNGETVVITSGKKQTLNEFAQTLVDLGVSNAIYLVGSTSPGFAVDKDRQRIDFGKASQSPPPNNNFIIWQ